MCRYILQALSLQTVSRAPDPTMMTKIAVALSVFLSLFASYNFTAVRITSYQYECRSEGDQCVPPPKNATELSAGSCCEGLACTDVGDNENRCTSISEGCWSTGTTCVCWPVYSCGSCCNSNVCHGAPVGTCG